MGAIMCVRVCQYVVGVCALKECAHLKADFLLENVLSKQRMCSFTRLHIHFYMCTYVVGIHACVK